MVGQGGKLVGEGDFDALRLAGQRQSLGGSLDVRTLPRAAERLADDGPVPLAWRIAGTSDAVGRPALEVALEGRVPLECQRCLRVFSWPVQQRTLLLLARDEAELARLDDIDEHEVLLAAAPLAVRTLVEDELLLTLPYVPRCGEARCEGAPVDAAPAVARAPTAFAALAGLHAPATKKQKRSN
ncbi:MAG: DUF177 domain-containing protein [Betaproteobacteria bacterium]|nr:DUF177 domain-containing protein [Betaproteobacteria bacterium]